MFWLLDLVFHRRGSTIIIIVVVSIAMTVEILWSFVFMGYTILGKI